MGHDLLPLPEDHPFEEDEALQCSKCGCTFSESGAKVADFVLSCNLEEGLRERDPELRAERPILV